MKTIAIIFILLFPSAILASETKISAVKSLDINKYLGTWYEIASFPQWFQKGCTATRANYKINEDNEIDVLNECNQNSIDGNLRQALGVAWVPNKNESAKLKVQFVLKWLRLPFLSGNYWVIKIDEDYTYSVVSDPSMKTLWILSRTKEMAPKTYQGILSFLKEKGYDIKKLKRTRHKKGAEDLRQ